MYRLSWNLGASSSWNHQCLSRPIMELLYLYLYHYLFWACVCSLSYPGWKAYAPYCYLCPALPYFPHIIAQNVRFLENVIKLKIRVLISQELFSATFLTLRRTKRDTILTVLRSSCKGPLIFWSFNETWIFSTDFWNVLRCKISWKSFQWEPSCSMQTWRS
jgi:hypothetical protein